MKLNELCTDFPQTPITHPADLLAAPLKVTLKSRLSRYFSGSDRLPLKTPNRLGQTLRPYLPGDPMRAIALQQSLKTDKLETRIDADDAHHRARILIHDHPGLYLNQKFSVSLLLAGMLEQIHINGNHSVTVAYMKNFANIHPNPKYQFTYLISDGLESLDNAEQIIRFYNEHTYQSFIFFCIRDVYETVEGARGVENRELKPPVGPDTWYGGTVYEDNLLKHRTRFLEALDDSYIELTEHSDFSMLLLKLNQFFMKPKFL